MTDMVTNEVGVVGIVESRNYCTLSPGYYTRVSKYIPWINENLEEFDPRHAAYLIKFDYFDFIILIVVIAIPFVFFGFILLPFITLYYYTTLPYNHWFRLLIFFEFFKAGSARDFVMHLLKNYEQELEKIEKLEQEQMKLSHQVSPVLNYEEDPIKCTYQLHRRTIKYVNDIIRPTLL